MQIFNQLIEQHTTERRLFSTLKNETERLILIYVGRAQSESDKGHTTLRELSTFGIAPVATLERAVARLKEIGAIQYSTCQQDRRRTRLTISKTYLNKFARFESKGGQRNTSDKISA